jgi:hypothetical protein
MRLPCQASFPLTGTSACRLRRGHGSLLAVPVAAP